MARWRGDQPEAFWRAGSAPANRRREARWGRLRRTARCRGVSFPGTSRRSRTAEIVAASEHSRTESVRERMEEGWDREGRETRSADRRAPLFSKTKWCAGLCEYSEGFRVGEVLVAGSRCPFWGFTSVAIAEVEMPRRPNCLSSGRGFSQTLFLT
jgi:hypothetical protein